MIDFPEKKGWVGKTEHSPNTAITLFILFQSVTKSIFSQDAGHEPQEAFHWCDILINSSQDQCIYFQLKAGYEKS